MIPTDRPCEPLHAAHRGEGMTGSHPQPAPHRETGTEDANDHLAIQAESRTSNFDLPALNSMRPTAPPSRPYGRYAVGLRPSLDPDACFDAPSQDKEARRTNQNNTEVGLDWPPSFRNDLRKSLFVGVWSWVRMGVVSSRLSSVCVVILSRRIDRRSAAVACLGTVLRPVFSCWPCPQSGGPVNPEERSVG